MYPRRAGVRDFQPVLGVKEFWIGILALGGMRPTIIFLGRLVFDLVLQ